jgi:HlyD family secretion protein
VIIARRVNVGQTVVASLNAPSLFLIAKDLRNMQVWASVNEADIGRIDIGCLVHFTVDAFPGETFRGKVVQVRLNAQSSQNVVTYTVIIWTDNSEMKLKPYLTANVQFEIDTHDDVLQVPNTALRWRPKLEQVAAAYRDSVAASLSGKSGGSGMGGGREGGPAGGASKTGGDAAAQKKAQDRANTNRVWVKDGNYVIPVDVKTGITDGSYVEVSGSDLKEGMEIVTGEIRKEDLSKGDDTKNPFLPQMPGRGGAKKQ